MGIQIFGKSKCFDTKKSERFFKERGVKVQLVDLGRYGMSKGEFSAVKKCLGNWEELLDLRTKDKEMLILLQHLSTEAAEEKLLEHPTLFRTPIVRNGKKATVGYCPDVWKEWLESL